MYSNRGKDPGKMGGASADPASEKDLVKSNIVHELDDEELEKLYMWVDEIPLSRPKKNMNRDFSDGVLAAEVIKYFLPHYVDLHNYTPASNNRLKADNWYHLNRKVLHRLNTELSQDLIDALCQCKPHAVQSLLCVLRDKIDLYLAGHMQRPSRHRQHPGSDMRPEADQDSRGYIPSAEGFYQDGQFQSPTTRRMYPEYFTNDPLDYHSTPSKQPPPSQRGIQGGEMLPRGLLDERVVAIENREQTISMLQAKIQGLEKLLTLKDLRIEDLSQKLDNLTQPTFHHPPRGGLSNRLGNQRGHVGRQQLHAKGGRF